MTPHHREYLSPAGSVAFAEDEPSRVQLFSVLTVCTGNICRSPAVERLLIARLGEDSGVQVSSAGTGAVVGAPVSGPMVPLIEASGASAEDFVACQLTEGIVREADLILPLTRRHRRAVVELQPAAVRRTFTVRELARLCQTVDPARLPDASPAERLAALIPLAAAERGRRYLHNPHDDDVPDPYGLSRSVYGDVFATLAPAVEIIARLARG